MTKTKCETCGWDFRRESNPGDYYDRKRHETHIAWEKVRAAEAEVPYNAAKVQKLRERAEEASYVGD